MLTVLIGLFLVATVILLIVGKSKNNKSLIAAGIVCGIITVILTSFVMYMLAFPVDSSV
jgi:hypothetical protein